MKLRHKTPCAECPWRKIAPNGWLGGHSAEMYADAVAGNEVPACHLNDHGPDHPRTAMCVGALSVMANSCTSAWKTEGGEEARKIVGRNDACFAHPKHFYEHHTGKAYVPFLLRREVA
jgi:hypothetical protein